MRSTGRCRSGRRARSAEFLAGLDDEDPNADRKPPKVISPSDPCSAWTAKANKRVQFGYGLNYLIDIENAVIVDVEPTPARTYDEVEATKTMIDRTERRFGLKPKRLVADTAYGTGRFLGWLVGHRITPHIPVREQGRARRRHVLAQRLPLGQTARRLHLPERQGAAHHRHRARRQHASLSRLQVRLRCLCRSRCSAVPMSPARQIPRDLHEDARDVTRRLMRTQGLHQVAR